MKKQSKKVVIVFLSVFCLILCLFLFFNQRIFYKKIAKASNSLQVIKNSELKVNQVYQLDTDGQFYFKLLEEEHFVLLQDNAQYKTQEDLVEYQTAIENNRILPSVCFSEGRYQKVADSYNLVIEESVYLEFETVDLSIEKSMDYGKFLLTIMIRN